MAQGNDPCKLVSDEKGVRVGSVRQHRYQTRGRRWPARSQEL